MKTSHFQIAFTALTALVLASSAMAVELPSSCQTNCAIELKECRKLADGHAMMEATTMPYSGTYNPTPNSHQLDAQKAYQAEVQKRHMDSNFQCEAQKNHCASACSSPADVPKKSVIFK